MAAEAKGREPSGHSEAERELGQVARERLERDWGLPMNERLARVHELCKQMTAIAGTARR